MILQIALDSGSLWLWIYSWNVLILVDTHSIIFKEEKESSESSIMSRNYIDFFINNKNYRQWENTTNYLYSGYKEDLGFT